MFFKDKSRIGWLKSGGKNTKFFPRKVASNIGMNRILRLKKDDGSIVTDYEQVKQIAVNFYENLFSKENDPPDGFKQVLSRALSKRLEYWEK